MEERDEEVMIEQIAQALRTEPIRKPGSSFDAQVMASIKWGERPSRVRSAATWFTRPRSVSLSPLTGFAAAAAVGAMAFLGGNLAVRSAVGGAQQSQQIAAVGHPQETTTQMVQFVLVAPDAKSVSLVGDFNDWDARATPLSAASGNTWTVQIPLTPGRYNYIFMVDGTRLVPDPAAPVAPANEFGQSSSVVTVGGSAL